MQSPNKLGQETRETRPCDVDSKEPSVSRKRSRSRSRDKRSSKIYSKPEHLPAHSSQSPVNNQAESKQTVSTHTARTIEVPESQ